MSVPGCFLRVGSGFWSTPARPATLLDSSWGKFSSKVFFTKDLLKMKRKNAILSLHQGNKMQNIGRFSLEGNGESFKNFFFLSRIYFPIFAYT